MTNIDKNIISNSCVCGYLYKKLNIQFNHPFMWNIITYNSFNKLIDEYEILNYNNIKISNSLLKNEKIMKKEWNDTFSIIIDNQLYVNYVHHKQNILHKTITRQGFDLYYYDMETYVKDLYMKRVKRMLENGLKKPIFIFNEFTTNPNKEEFYKLLYKPTKYKKIALIPHNYSIGDSKIPENTFTVSLPSDVNNEGKYSDFLIKNHLDLLEIY